MVECKRWSRRSGTASIFLDETRWEESLPHKTSSFSSSSCLPPSPFASPPHNSSMLPVWLTRTNTFLIKMRNKEVNIIATDVLQCSFPFSMGWQSAPTGRYLQEDRSFWTLRAVYLPPLLRSATVRKFMAGYELVSEPQRDITPEKVSLYRRSSWSAACRNMTVSDIIERTERKRV